ncbi:MAG: hypothetical protein Q8M76_10505 [Spirochaetaceae bacterium]|nr:hypothetical protein [Spirochaetaceae bacterium]
MGKDAVLRALGGFGAPSPGHLRPENAPWLELRLEDDSWTGDNGLFLGLPQWLSEAGILSSPDRRWVVYLKPREGRASYFPATLLLRLAAGRYSILTWDCERASAAGIEVASAPPLVCSPPCSGSPLVLVISALTRA